mmetsp:Transcript_3495/g.9382  ORF Transcript_3495/g.9382 Transcript_3495/m.9382 type:complete len:174 (-) Transcript_3495:64-585(-)
MMMLTQCTTFQVSSISYWEDWHLKKRTLSKCDWREAQDLIAFQTFLAKVNAKDGWPDLTSFPVGLSVILAAQHNLVTYGVPFRDDEGQWINPGPNKTFYTPREAVQSVVASRLFEDDAAVQAWGASAGLRWDVEHVPGMACWVAEAKSKWANESFLRVWSRSHNQTVEQIMAF